MNDDLVPRKRAGNADRERVAATLQEAFSDGQLSITEFDERSRQLWSTVYADELATLTADLSPVHRGDIANPAPPVPSAPVPVTGESGGSAASFALMGGSEKTGGWLVAPSHTSVAVMGGTLLDLRHARLTSHETVINAAAIMGGIEIVVPEDVRVIDDGLGIMGGFGITHDKSCTLRPDQLPADAPVIRVRGVALMGGVEIRRAARDAQL